LKNKTVGKLAPHNIRPVLSIPEQDQGIKGLDAINTLVVTQQLVCRTAEGLEEEGKIEWMAESGIIGFEQVGHKYVSRFTVRAELEKGADIYMEMQVDDGVWKRMITYARPGLRSFNIPVLPGRCDHLKLRFGGHGDCRVYSVSKHLREGSERSW
jgi:hypothetical protein